MYDQNVPMAISAEQNIDKLTSSRLLEKIPINLSLSNKGTSLLDASWRTLALKSNQLNSLFIYLRLTVYIVYIISWF